MKSIKLARRWNDQVTPTTVHAYPAGWSGRVADDVAQRAAKAGVLATKKVAQPRTSRA